MTDRSNLEIVQEIYAAFGRGDVQAILDRTDPAVRWECAGPRDIPWAGSYRGPDGVREFFSTLAAQVDVLAFETQTFIAQGDKVIVLGFERFRAKPTGREFEEHWAMAWTLAGGKATAFREYTDTAAIAAAFRS